MVGSTEAAYVQDDVEYGTPETDNRTDASGDSYYDDDDEKSDQDYADDYQQPTKMCWILGTRCNIIFESLFSIV